MNRSKTPYSRPLQLSHLYFCPPKWGESSWPSGHYGVNLYPVSDLLMGVGIPRVSVIGKLYKGDHDHCGLWSQQLLVGLLCKDYCWGVESLCLTTDVSVISDFLSTNYVRHQVNVPFGLYLVPRGWGIQIVWNSLIRLYFQGKPWKWVGFKKEEDLTGQKL